MRSKARRRKQPLLPSPTRRVAPKGTRRVTWAYPNRPRGRTRRGEGRNITGPRSLRGFIRGRERRGGYVGWNSSRGFCAAQAASALAALLTERGGSRRWEQAVQFFFDERWRAIVAYCAERGIRILGDVAIFVNYDSAEVWRHPELFELDEKGGMVRVSGVPPDWYSATSSCGGGNPLYRWEVLKKRGFDWWVARVRRSLRRCTTWCGGPLSRLRGDSVDSGPEGRRSRGNG